MAVSVDVSLAVGEGDCDGLAVWAGLVEELGDEDGEVSDVVGDGDCEPDCVGLAVAAGEVGHAVAVPVPYGLIAVGCVPDGRLPDPGIVVEAGFVPEPPPVDTYCVAAGLADAVG